MTLAEPAPVVPPTVADELIAAARLLHSRGLLPATSGNLSRRIDRAAIAITRSGRDKGRLGRDDLMVVDLDGRAIAPPTARPSAETALHCQLYRRFAHAAAVLHVHSPASTVLSRLVSASSIRLHGWELEKALAGVTTHEHEEIVPIVPNRQDMTLLTSDVARVLAENSHAYLIAGHGLYTWGADVDEALRHVEALEFLFECELRTFAAKEIR